MDRKEFLEGLRSYLEPEMSAEEIRENINYYERYITEEVIKGRREEDVVQELGDPWVIAKTITDMKENSANYDSSHESTYEEAQNRRSVKTFQINSTWKRILFILAIVGIVFVIFSVITGIIGLFAPILFPLLVVITVFRFFNRRS